MTKVLQCGRFNEENSTVVVTVDPCPNAADGQCVHVHYNQVDSKQFTEVHLGIDDQPLTDDSPGQLNFNDKCALTNGGNTADCYVPLSEIGELFDPDVPVNALCGKKIWIGAHTTVPGNTCWGQGTDIDDGNNNWAQNFDVTFTCPNNCV